MTTSPIETWDAAVANFSAFVDSVDDWSTATPCPGWNIADVVAHTVDLESLLADDDRPDHSPDWSRLPDITSDFGRFTEIGVDYRRGTSPDELLVELAGAHERARARLMSMPEDAAIPWLRGETPLPKLLGMRTFDIWMHEIDARLAVRQLGNLDGPGSDQARAYLTAGLPKSWGKGAQAPVGAVLHLIVDGPGQMFESWVQVDDSGRASFVDEREATTAIEMSWLAFVALSGGRQTEQDFASSAMVDGDARLGDAFLAAMAVTP